jgi:hypothetical protein
VDVTFDVTFTVEMFPLYEEFVEEEFPFKLALVVEFTEAEAFVVEEFALDEVFIAAVEFEETLLFPQ